MKIPFPMSLIAATATVLATSAVAALTPGSAAGEIELATTQVSSGPSVVAFHPVVREPAAKTGDYAAEYTVYRPADLGEIRGRLPVVVFENGACRHRSNDELLSTEALLAAHGFLVIAVGAFDQPGTDENGSLDPQLIADGITWAERENRRPGSDLRNRIDFGQVDVAGHSCGGIEALWPTPTRV